MSGNVPSLGMNVDVTNTAFWIGGQDLATLMCTYLPASSKGYDKNSLRNGSQLIKFRFWFRLLT
jgi:hypothetical protein